MRYMCASMMYGECDEVSCFKLCSSSYLTSTGCQINGQYMLYFSENILNPIHVLIFPHLFSQKTFIPSSEDVAEVYQLLKYLLGNRHNDMAPRSLSHTSGISQVSRKIINSSRYWASTVTRPFASEPKAIPGDHWASKLGGTCTLLTSPLTSKEAHEIQLMRLIVSQSEPKGASSGSGDPG